MLVVPVLCGGVGWRAVSPQSYVTQHVGHYWSVVIQVLGLLTAVLLNILGMSWVSKSAGIYVVLTLLPFIVQLATVKMHPGDWVGVPKHIQVLRSPPLSPPLPSTPLHALVTRP